MIKRELFAYLVAGVMTTAINIIVYHLCYSRLGIANLYANAIAWVLAVAFAYVANDLFVFTKTKGGTKAEQFSKIFKFFGVRLFTLLVDEIGMYLFVDIGQINNIFSKVVINVIIVILNYILSKWYVFQKKSKRGN